MMGSEVYLHVTAAGKDAVLRIPTTELTEEQRGGFSYGTEIHFPHRKPDTLPQFFRGGR